VSEENRTCWKNQEGQDKVMTFAKEEFSGLADIAIGD